MEYEQEPHHSNVANYKTSKACTPATLWITKRSGSSPQQHCEIQNVRELHHSNIVNYETNKSFTTSRLWITKRAGAAPQQHNKGQCLRELHHSNIVNQKGTGWLDKLLICSKWNLIWTHFEFISKYNKADCATWWFEPDCRRWTHPQVYKSSFTVGVIRAPTRSY
jgi:hypothetical protein